MTLNQYLSLSVDTNDIEDVILLYDESPGVKSSIYAMISLLEDNIDDNPNDSSSSFSDSIISKINNTLKASTFPVSM